MEDNTPMNNTTIEDIITEDIITEDATKPTTKESSTKPAMSGVDKGVLEENKPCHCGHDTIIHTMLKVHFKTLLVVHDQIVRDKSCANITTYVQLLLSINQFIQATNYCDEKLPSTETKSDK